MTFEIKSLGDICEINLGKTPARKINKFWDVNKKTNNVWLSIADLGNAQNKQIGDSKEYISDEGAKLFKPVKAGTLLMSFKLTIGRLAFAAQDLRTNEAIVALPIKNTKILLNDYLYYYLDSYDWDKESENDIKLKGRTLNKKKLNKIPVIVPPVAVQGDIVKKLDLVFYEVDRALIASQKNLTNSLSILESCISSLFKSYDSISEKKHLKEVALDFGRGKSKHRPRNDEILYGGDYPFIQTGDVSNAPFLITEYSQTYNETGLKQSKLWKKGTICITIAANIAEVAILDFDSCFPDSIIGLVVNPEYADSEYVYYMLLFTQALLKSKGKGNAQDNINLGTFEALKFPFPPLEVQREMAEKLRKISYEVESLDNLYKQKIQLIKELKKSILHKAINGKLANN